MTIQEVEQLRSELGRAHQRIEALAARVAHELRAKEAPHWLYFTLEMAGIGVWDWDITLDKVGWTEAAYQIFGQTHESFGGDLKTITELTFEADRPLLAEKIQITMATGAPYRIEYRIRRPDGAIRWVAVTGQLLRDEAGRPLRLAGTVVDVTDRKREDAERLAMQQKIIDAQSETLRELGAPIIPLADQTLAVPLVGQLTRERAEVVADVLLRAVRDYSAQVVLLDITGVPVVDSAVAHALVKAAHAVRLLGAQVVLTGVRPQVAQTLVTLGMDMQAFVIQANLQSGIEYVAQLRKNQR